MNRSLAPVCVNYLPLISPPALKHLMLRIAQAYGCFYKVRVQKKNETFSIQEPVMVESRNRLNQKNNNIQVCYIEGTETVYLEIARVAHGRGGTCKHMRASLDITEFRNRVKQFNAFYIEGYLEAALAALWTKHMRARPGYFDRVQIFLYGPSWPLWPIETTVCRTV